MICLICRHAEMVNGLTAISFARGEVRLFIRGVPARVCPSCGESYVEEAVAVRLLQAARKTSEAGILDGVIEYHHLS